MIATLRQRRFGTLWLAGLISVIGDWLIVAALPFYVYEQTKSPLAVGGLFIAYYAPRVLVSPLAGVLVDRLDRKRILVVTDLARVPLLLALLAVHGPAQLWILYLAVLAESALGQFFLPAKGALLPQLVDNGQLTAANALNALNTNVGRLLGSALAEVTLATWGLAGIALIDAASYGLSGLLIASITIARAQPLAAPRTAVPQTTLWDELRAALQIVRRERVVRGLFVVFGAVNLADSITALLFVVFVQDILGAGAPELGWLLAAGAAGGMLGGAAVVRLSRVVPPTRLVALGAAGVGICFLLMFHLPVLALAIVLQVLLGLPLLCMNVSGETLLQQHVADAYRGRVLAAFYALVGLLYVLGLGAISLLSMWFGTLVLLDGAVVLYLIAGILAALLLREAS